MQTMKQFCSRETVIKVILLLSLALFSYLVRSMFNLILLTFVVTYLVNSLQGLILKQVNRVVKVSSAIVTIIMYIIMTVSLVLIGVKYIPIAISESILILDKMEYITFPKSTEGVWQYVGLIFNEMDLASYSKSGIESIMVFVTNLGKGSLNFFMAFLLSLIFILEKERILRFIHKFRESKISTAYKYLSYFGNNFLNSFGKVVQAQIMIAITNTVLSVIGLAILGFPQLFALAFMILILSLVPVAGVFISLIPLCLIALKIGGIIKVIFVLVMIFVIHAIESYVLNPKLMSNTTNLPAYITFIVLIVSEHIIGTWGLLLGIPIFIFILDLIGIDLTSEKKIRIKKNHGIQ